MGAPRDGLGRARQAKRQPIEPLRFGLERRARAPRQRELEVAQDALLRRAGGRHELGGGGRRRGAQVGGEIDEGHVGLVADAAHDLDRRRPHGTHDALVVEGPEILERAAAAADDEHVDLAPLSREPDRGAQGRRRLDALDQARIDDDPDVRRPARERRHDVVQRRSGERGDDTDRARVRRQRPLAARGRTSPRLRGAREGAGSARRARPGPRRASPRRRTGARRAARRPRAGRATRPAGRRPG